jgi:uncharacterized protein YdeI (YjbR/CyaY-like superfamily)
VPRTDPRVDTYIEKAAEFAQPILRHFRALVHKAEPKIEEAMKWSMPFFLHQGIVCNMAAFKNHASINFWKGNLIFDGDTKKREEALGNFGKLTSVTQLPADRVMIGYIRKAVELNTKGVKKPAREKKDKAELTVPAELASSLRKNKAASIAFDKFSYSHRKEYIDWISGAKREETRQKRVAQAVEWISRGKPQNWRYMSAER